MSEVIYNDEYVNKHMVQSKLEGHADGLEEAVDVVNKMVLSTYLDNKDNESKVLRELSGFLFALVEKKKQERVDTMIENGW